MEMVINARCAYNQTREAFLGLQVALADIPYSGLNAWMQTLVLRSGEGIWLNPFRGLPAGNAQTSLDLIYLDENCRVIEIVEGFPTFRASGAGSRPASVLALPAHSIYSSQTQLGDKLLLCMAEEMRRLLDTLECQDASEAAFADRVQEAVLLREKPLWSEGPGTLELEQKGRALNVEKTPHEMGLVKPDAARPSLSRRNWLQRWWSPDPRRAPRDPAQGLAAYYWNGASPEAHGIRDISSSGLYVITEERWYPGTLVLMTLQRTDLGDELAERTIAVQSRAVRWGQDGVGLQFILPGQQDYKRGLSPLMEGADRKQFDRFLEQLKNGR